MASKFEGSRNVDTFILESNLKWIPYDKFKNVEFLYEVRFAITYKAIWSLKSGDKEVILKSSNSNLDEPLINELIYHANCLESTEIINLYGYTKNPDTLNYMAVMEYAINSNFAKVIEMNWKQRLFGSHPQTFSSKVVDETLESEDSEASYYTILGSENLDDFIKTDEN
ncbi:unnamed protein product [Rhizophagus irregularis]|nr:unnamed protein product [Rhizophagus irregularis]